MPFGGANLESIMNTELLRVLVRFFEQATKTLAELESYLSLKKY